MNWAPKNIPEILAATWQHLVLSVSSVLIGLVIALILGIICARRPKLYAVVLTITGIIFVIPSLALFALLIPVAWPWNKTGACWAIFLLSAHPVAQCRDRSAGCSGRCARCG